MTVKKKKSSVKKKLGKQKPLRPALRTQKQLDEEYLLILIRASERYMDSPDDFMGQQVARLKKELKELKSK